MCTDRKLNYLSGSWWPKLADLDAAGIPYSRFIQEPGDYVYTNMGTIHWVQALGRCQNVAWNIGPMVGTQLRMAWERYYEMRAQKEQSLVPLHKLTWSLVDYRKQNSKYADEFVAEIESRAQTSLAEQKAMVAELGVSKVKITPFEQGAVAHVVCCECLDEPFNTFFVKVGAFTKPGVTADVYCFKCTKAFSKAFADMQCFQHKPVATLEAMLAVFREGGRETGE